MEKTVIGLALGQKADTPAAGPFKVTKGDIAAYRLDMHIFDGDIEFSYETATTARLVFANSNGLITTNDRGVISSSGIIYDIEATEISFPGRVIGAVQLLDDTGKRLTVSRFMMDVLADPLDAGPPLPTVPEIEQLTAYITAVEQALVDVYGGVHLTGAFETYEDFIAASITGHPGDIYLAGNALYVWIETTETWLNVGPIQGFGLPVSSDTVEFEFDEGSATLEAHVKKQMSIAADASGIKLEGDQDIPDNNSFYGVVDGAKGYHAFPVTMSLEQDGDGLHLVNDVAAPNENEFYGYAGGERGYHDIRSICVPLSYLDGWIPSIGWVYVSATSITIPGDIRGIIRKCDKIRWKQGGAYRYNYVIAEPTYNAGSNLSTVQVTSGYQSSLGDCSFAASPGITDASFSHVSNPIGFPHWFTLAAPTFAGIDNGSGGQPTTKEHRFAIEGSMYKVHYGGGGIKAGAGPNISYPLGTYPAIANTADRKVLGTSYVQSATDTPIIGIIIAFGSTIYITSPTSIADDAAITNWGFQLWFEL